MERGAVSWGAWQAGDAPRHGRGTSPQAGGAIIDGRSGSGAEARRRARRRRRAALLGALLLFAALVIGFVISDLRGDGADEGVAQVPPSRAPSPPSSPVASSSGLPAAFGITPAGDAAPVWPPDLIVPSERSFKADQIERLPYAPEVVFFGGSRSMRFEPAFMEEKTGLEGFNLAMTNGKPEDAWVFAHFLHDRSPRTKLRWVWGVQVSTMYERDLEAGLIQDPRLNRYLPLDLLVEQGRSLPRTPEEVPKVARSDLRRYGRDGVVLFNSYDRAEAHGKTLEESLGDYIAQALARQKEAPTSSAEKKSRSRDYFEATLGYLESIGGEAVIVAMPVHPEVLDVLRTHGWQKSHERFLAYIRSLQERYDLRFIDLSEIESFGGDPDQFYDGVHIKAVNARRVITKLVRTFPDTFSRDVGE